MLRRVIPLLVAVLLALTIAAGALETRVASPRVALSFQGTTATCIATVRDEGAKINVKLELWCGGTLVDSWQKSGTSTVTINEQVAVTSGKTYRLSLSGTSNGTEIPPQNTSKTCP